MSRSAVGQSARRPAPAHLAVGQSGRRLAPLHLVVGFGVWRAAVGFELSKDCPRASRAAVGFELLEGCRRASRNRLSAPPNDAGRVESGFECGSAHVFAQVLHVANQRQPLERGDLELANAFARDVHDRADVFERRSAVLRDVERAGDRHLPDFEIGEVELDRAGAPRDVEVQVIAARDERARAAALRGTRRAWSAAATPPGADASSRSKSRLLSRRTLIVRARTARLRRERRCSRVSGISEPSGAACSTAATRSSTRATLSIFVTSAHSAFALAADDPLGPSSGNVHDSTTAICRAHACLKMRRDGNRTSCHAAPNGRTRCDMEYMDLHSAAEHG